MHLWTPQRHGVDQSRRAVCIDIVSKTLSQVLLLLRLLRWLLLVVVAGLLTRLWLALHLDGALVEWMAIDHLHVGSAEYVLPMRQDRIGVGDSALALRTNWETGPGRVDIA